MYVLQRITFNGKNNIFHPSTFLVFIISETSKSRQKILSQYDVDIGNIPPKTVKTIRINLISLVEGNMELRQLVRYKLVDDMNSISDYNENEADVSSNVESRLGANQNVSLEYINNAVVKTKHDTIIIPCTPEFAFSGNFFSLNRDPIQKAIKYEEFLFEVEVETKSIDIEILDMFLITVSKTL